MELKVFPHIQGKLLTFRTQINLKTETLTAICARVVDARARARERTTISHGHPPNRGHNCVDFRQFVVKIVVSFEWFFNLTLIFIYDAFYANGFEFLV